MGTKDLLLVAICATGLAVVASIVVDAGGSRRNHLPFPPRDAAFQGTVERVDHTFRQAWQSAGVSPSVRAADLAIARRLSLSLTGTIPSLEEIRRFEQQPAEGRIDWWLARLLADRRCSDYLAERFARAYVGVEDGPFLLYRRRRFVAWLSESIHQNRPYDAVVRDLIADTGLWTDRPATNFITVAMIPETNYPDPDKLAVRVCRSMLGLRIDCAQCHDHPFDDRWTQRGFQSLAAYFGSTEQGLSGIYEAKRPYKVEDYKSGEQVTIEPDVPFDGHLLPDEGTLRQRLAGWVTHPDNRAFARATVNRMWTLLFARPLVEPLDDIPLGEPRPDQPEQIVLDRLADEFAGSGYDLHRLIRLIAATEVFRLESRAIAVSGDAAELTDVQLHSWAAFPLTRLRPEQVVGGLLQSVSLTTVDYHSHILRRIIKVIGQQEFVERYGDVGENELTSGGGTIPQRLLMLNGKLVDERTDSNPLMNAATRIAMLAPTDESAVETAYLAVLTRRPTTAESGYFTEQLTGPEEDARSDKLGDLYWALLNSSEFSYHH